MSLAHENNLKVKWVTTLADPSAPTTTELDAGDDLTPFIPVSGVDRPSQQNQASLAMLDDAFISEEPGTWSVGPINLTFVRDPDNEDASHPWQLFSYGTSGYLVMSPNNAFASADEVSVYTVKCHEPAELPSAENTKQQFTVSFPVSAFERRATVAT